MDITRLKRLATKGKKDAQHELGKCFLTGKDVMQDIHEAEKWFKMAAKKNHAESLYELGVIKCAQHDIDLALNYLNKALKQKLSKAYRPLGEIYRGDFDPNIEDKRKAAECFYAYYRYDKYDGLEPLLSTFSKDVFKNIKHTHRFLKEAMDYGLVKAKYHLGLLYLTEKKVLNPTKGLELLEGYYDATADVNAAKELYYLFAPSETKYPAFKAKEPHKAKEYLRFVIEGDGVLTGTEFIQEHGVHVPLNRVPVNHYLEKNVNRMRTSLAIDETFSKTVSIDTFDVSLAFDMETLYDYEATIAYKERVIEEEIIEKEVQKKQAVRKGLKKTGTVKIPKTIKKTKKHKSWEDREVPLEHKEIEAKEGSVVRYDSLREMMHGLGNHHYPFEFGDTPDQEAMRKTVEARIDAQLDLPKKIKKLKKDFSFRSLVIAKPKIHVHYQYKNTAFDQIVDLSDKDALDDLRFPLNKSFARTLRRFNRRQRGHKLNQAFITFLWVLLWPASLYHLQIAYLADRFADSTIFTFAFDYYLIAGLGLIIGIVTGLFFRKFLRTTTIEEADFIRHYDDATLEIVKERNRKNASRMVIRFLIVLLIAGVNLYFYLS